MPTLIDSPHNAKSIVVLAPDLRHGFPGYEAARSFVRERSPASDPGPAMLWQGRPDIVIQRPDEDGPFQDTYHDDCMVKTGATDEDGEPVFQWVPSECHIITIDADARRILIRGIFWSEQDEAALAALVERNA